MNAHKNVVVAVVLLAVVSMVGFAYYRYAITKEDAVVTGEFDPTTLRELSVEVTYAIPNGDERNRFSIFVNDDGIIGDVNVVDVRDPNSQHQTYNEAFAKALLTRIKGRKLSNLGPVDRVGTASLTTDAFNSALDDLKAQLQ